MKHLARKFTSFNFSTSAPFLTKNIKKFHDGTYPQALIHSRPFYSSKLSNGITVATEIMPSNILSVAVFIKCGSRNQSQSSSGTAHFLQHLHFKGTKNRTKQQLQLEVQNMGGNLNAYTSRQNTCYWMSVQKNDLSKAIDILGDMITNSLYRKPDVQNQRSTIQRQLIQTQKSNPLQTTIQISHRGVYRDHQMGLPILGYIHNMKTISREMIADYHNNNYKGDNIIVVGSGDINHQQLVSIVQKYIKAQKRNGAQKKPQLIKPIFHSGFSSLQSHLTPLVNMVIINQAPSFFDNDFFAYLLLQRILADRPQNPFQIQIMKNSTSYRFQKHLAPFQFIQKQKGFYSSYWDTGLYGNYFLCDPKKTQQIINLTYQGYSMYSNKITDEQLQRAKRRVYVEILQHQSQNDITQAIGNNLMYYDRRVCTKQLAQRVSVVTAQDLQKVASKIVQKFDDSHVCFWGNVKKINFLKEMKA